MSYYKKTEPNDDWVEYQMVKAYLPPALYSRLKDQSRLLGLPMSRLIAIAVDNELDQERPFYYNTELPDEEYQEYMHAAEGAKLLDYITKFPSGVGRDELCLARHEIGFNDRLTVLLALRELLEKDMVDEVLPKRKKFNMWLDNYRLIRAKDLVYNERKAKRFKRNIDGTLRRKHRITDKDVEE